MLVNRLGYCCYYHCALPESFHDVRILYESSLYERGNSLFEAGDEGLILYDKAFDGVEFGNRLITPFKKPYGCRLTQRQKAFNKIHASRRIIVENFFARLKTLWPISKFYKYDRDEYHIHFPVCCILTNMYTFFEEKYF